MARIRGGCVLACVFTLFTLASSSQAPQFGAKLVAGSSSITVIANSANDTLSIYAFDPGTIVTTCGNVRIPYGSPLLFNTTAAGSTTTSTVTTTTITAGQPTVLTLSQPLVTGQTLCLVDTHPSTWLWDVTPSVVVDPTDYGRFKVYSIIGIQASNQQSTTGSSTAGEYLEVGFASSYAIGSSTRWGAPGFATNVDVRLSPIPVSGSTSTTTTTSALGAATTISPNQLSSQDGVRLVSSIYAPKKVKGWNNKADYFTFGPAARGGFGTLLNSSASSSSGAGATTQLVTTTFAPAFDFWSLGARFAWDRFAASPDEGPQPITQFVVTLGEDSNLPSYVCKASKGSTNPYATQTVITACNIGANAPTGSATTGYSYFNYSRTLTPRIDVEGFAKLPQYPFVLGIDANLQQYTVLQKQNIDYLNKPGNDIRVYVGLKIDLQTLISKL